MFFTVNYFTARIQKVKLIKVSIQRIGGKRPVKIGPNCKEIKSLKQFFYLIMRVSKSFSCDSLTCNREIGTPAIGTAPTAGWV